MLNILVILTALTDKIYLSTVSIKAIVQIKAYFFKWSILEHSNISKRAETIHSRPQISSSKKSILSLSGHP